MSGTPEGGKKIAITNKAKDPDFYKKIGTLGGKVHHRETRYFVLHPGIARVAGAKGGHISRLPKKGEVSNNGGNRADVDHTLSPPPF